MSIKITQSELQQCAFMSFETPSVSIEGGSTERPATQTRYRDGHLVPGTATSRGKAGLVLPPPETKRWSSRRKAAILVAVRIGVITRVEACQRYLLSQEELASWQVSFERSGIRGLLVTKLQADRRRYGRGNGVS